jgi:hypothetical protein
MMRFMVCARDRETGAIVLVSEDSFANRREAVEAIAGSRDVERLLGADVFLVDLNAATPVAVISVSGATAEYRVETVEGTPSVPGLGDTDDVEVATSDTDAEVRLDIGEMDIETWTCEDCIYVVTCEKSGTLRPAECDSFQWRA